jgi:hypothetical protein
MRDSRNAPRTTSKQPAVAVLGDRSEVDCALRDLSSTGARLAFRHPIFLPKAFRLRFGSYNERVTVVWQRGLYAGVRFQSPIRLAKPKKKKLSLPFFS